MKLTPKLRNKLETNTTAHGLIEDEEVKAAFEELPAEALWILIHSGDWFSAGADSRAKGGTYRLRSDWQPPVEVEKMQPPWDMLIDEIICVARDKDGEVDGYSACPVDFHEFWSEGVQCHSYPLTHIKFPRGNAPWYRSLVWRPGHEPKGE